MGRPRKNPAPEAQETKQAEQKNGYEVPENEKDLYHVLLEKVKFDPATGERLSIPNIKKFNPRAWLQTQKSLKTLGYTRVEILHEPKK